jgi:hypothetical protein
LSAAKTAVHAAKSTYRFLIDVSNIKTTITRTPYAAHGSQHLKSGIADAG